MWKHPPVVRWSTVFTAASRFSEGDHALEHRPLELAAVLDVVRRVSEVLLVHVLDLRENVGREEPAAAELPPVRAEVAEDARQRAVRLVVARADEQALLRQEAVDGVDRVLLPGAVRELGRGLALCALHHAK